MAGEFENLIMRDTRANQPATGVPGRLYYVTDENVTERDNGSTWEDVSDAGTGGSGSELVYVEFTSNVSPTATTEATANTVVTGSAVAYDGSTPVIIEFFANNARPDANASGRTMTFWLYDGSSSIGQIGFISGADAGGQNRPTFVRRRLTPSAATHTYSIRASVSAGTGLVAAGAGGAGNAAPGFIRITRANP